MKRQPSSSTLRRSKRQRRNAPALDSNHFDDDSTSTSFLPNAEPEKQSQYEAPNPAYPPASLLGLPVELRLHILGYLLPDVKVIPNRDEDEYEGYEDGIFSYYRPASRRPTEKIRELRELEQKLQSSNPPPAPCMLFPSDEDRLACLKREIGVYIPLRQDMESCWPNILQVNHQLYDEGSDLTYKGKTFQVVLSPINVNVCSETFFTDFDWPQRMRSERKEFKRQFRQITSVNVRIMGTSQDERFTLRQELKNRINHFVLHLKTAVRLKHLRVDLILESFCSENKPESEMLRDEANANWLLRPFGLLRGMENAEILINNDSSTYRLKFTKHIRGITSSICSTAPVIEKEPLVDLYEAYSDNYRRAFPEQRGQMQRNFDSNNLSPLERAWLACDNADLDEFRKIRKWTQEAYKRQVSFVWCRFKDIKRYEDEGAQLALQRHKQRPIRASMKIAGVLGEYNDEEENEECGS